MMSDQTRPAKNADHAEADLPAPYELPDLPSLLTRPLGLEGWIHLEPVILAALASEDPMLLVGAHGTAKSFLLERLAQALGLEYRFYNASLINFDDLVGIPMPDDEQASLRYISTPTAVWDAEVVFFDEISRTRPELQNKLFPIIHEKRVQGIALEKLRYRWSAMNPPPSEDACEDRPDLYLGAEPLDPALADRFAFILEVPTWDSLTITERRSILCDQFGGEHGFDISLPDLAAICERILRRLEKRHPAVLQDYLLTLVTALSEGKVSLSTRRITTLYRGILAVHAARTALYSVANPELPAGAVDWGTSALLALQHSLPQTALGVQVNQALLLGAHRHAWEVSKLDSSNPWRVLFAIGDPTERCVAAFEMGDAVSSEDLSQLVLDALGAEPNEVRRKALALAVYGASDPRHSLLATAYETIAREILDVLRPNSTSVAAGSCPRHRYKSALSMGGDLRAETDPQLIRRSRFAANFLQSLIGNGLDEFTPSAALKVFTSLWDRLSVPQAA